LSDIDIISTTPGTTTTTISTPGAPPTPPPASTTPKSSWVVGNENMNDYYLKVYQKSEIIRNQSFKYTIR